MESVMCGNYNDAVFSFTNGVATIPNGTTWYGDKVLPVIDERNNGIRGCFSITTTFPYDDYFITPDAGGQEYPYSSYTVNASGCTITLEDTTFNGNLQVYYAYKNGEYLSPNELYRTYPRNTKCIVDNDLENLDYQISTATDGVHWTAIALKELTKLNMDTTYSNYADDLLQQLNNDMEIATTTKYLFDASQVGRTWFNSYIYDENAYEVESAIATVTDSSKFTVNEITGFKVGKPVRVNGEERDISLINGNEITLSSALSNEPNIDDTCYFLNRNAKFSLENKTHLKFEFGSDSDAGAINWSIGNSFSLEKDSTYITKVTDASTFEISNINLFNEDDEIIINNERRIIDAISNKQITLETALSETPKIWDLCYTIEKDLQFIIKGDGSNSLRQIALKDQSNKEYYYSWLDTSNEDQTFNLSKTEFVALDNIVLDANRLPYMDPYIAMDASSSGTLSLVNYNNSYTDTDAIKYPVWHKFEYNKPSNSGWCKVGVGIDTENIITNSSGHLELILAANASKTIDIEIIDSSVEPYPMNSHTITNVSVGTTPGHYKIEWSSFNNGAIAHPIKNIQLCIQDYDSGTLYWGGAAINSKELFTDTESKFLKFETRQETAGSFSVATVSNGVLIDESDKYKYSGVPVFSLEYTEMGLMGWRSGSYTGYTNPLSWVYYPDSYYNNHQVAIEFLKDAQDVYYNSFGVLAPFVPVYLRNLTENLDYGSLETWTWNGPDPNTSWAGFQYRTLVNVAEYYFKRAMYGDAIKDEDAQEILNRWVVFLYNYLLTNNTPPSTFNSDGSIENTYEAVDFLALIGRAMMLKYLVDEDKEAEIIMKLMLSKLLSKQQENGAFKITGDNIYNFHQAEALIFLGQYVNYYASTDIRKQIIAS